MMTFARARRLGYPLQLPLSLTSGFPARLLADRPLADRLLAARFLADRSLAARFLAALPSRILWLPMSGIQRS